MIYRIPKVAALVKREKFATFFPYPTIVVLGVRNEIRSVRGKG